MKTQGRFTYAILDIKTMAMRSLLKSIRSPDTLLLNIAIPVMTMLVFVYVFGGAMNTGDTSYINYIFPGVLLLCIGQSGSATALSVSTDIQKGVIDRFRSMPITRSSVLIGHVLEAMVRTIVTVILILMIALLVGFRTSAGIVGWLTAFGLLLLFSLTITWISVAFALAVNSPEAAGSFTMFVMLFSYLSSGFVPTDTLTKVLRIFAENQPMTPIIESLRALLLDTALDNNLLYAILWCVGLLIVAYILAVQMYKRKLAK